MNPRSTRSTVLGAGLASMLAVPLLALGGPSAALGAAAAAPGGDTTPGAADNYAPSSRVVRPVSVHSTAGTVTAPGNVLEGRTTRLVGQHAAVTLDFGKDVAGLVSLHFAGSSDAAQRVGLAFTESSLYVGENSDSSNGGTNGTDGAIYADVPGQGSYTMPQAKLRGGFRYLTVFLDTTGTVDLNRVRLRFTASPAMKDLRDYKNYFHSSDPLLNKIWYAGAYTAQLGTIAPDTGRVWGPPASGWDNSGVVGLGRSVLVDGAKRDRTVWPGDLGVAVPTSYVSTDDMRSVRNALDTLLSKQTVNGELPFAGPEVNFYGSDTYHMWTLVGMANYVTYTDDRAWLRRHFSQYRAGVRFILDKVDTAGLLSVTGTADWARSDQGGENIEANAILYRVLRTGAALARTLKQPDLDAQWSQAATRLKDAANARLWDADAGLYRDNPTSSLHPQDGNSLAVWYGLTARPDQSTSISQHLTDNWNSFGATTPEKDGNIATFPGSMEVQAHFVAGQDTTGLELIRREWGYMLNSPIGTGSTFWEGYKADGSFDYSGSYMSLAHGWATGPTSALSFFVLGTEPDDAPGTFGYLPHPGDLQYAEGRIQLPQGALDASWDRDRDTGTITEKLTSPQGSTGRVGVPTFGRPTTVTFDGETVWDGNQAVGPVGEAHGVSLVDGYVVLDDVAAGSHVLTGEPQDAAPRSLTVTARPQQVTAQAGRPFTSSVTVTAASPELVSGAVTPHVPAGWTASPASRPVSLDGRLAPASQTVDFTITPADDATGTEPVAFTADAGGLTATDTLQALVLGQWAPGTTAEVSSFHAPNIYNGAERTYAAANAIDGDLATFWNDDTSGGYPDDLTVTTPQATTLDGVTLASLAEGVPVDFTVDTWDGTSWVTQTSVTDNTAVTRRIDFGSPVSTTRVRLRVTRDQAQNGAFTRVVELTP